MSTEGYIRQKLSLAVDSLALSAAPIQERLASAAISHLSILRRSDFDGLSEEQEIFDRLSGALTAVEPRGEEGKFVASTAAMSDEQAVALARDLAELRDRMALRSEM